MGDFEKGGIVRDGERLQWGVGADAVGADGLEVRCVEGGEKRVRGATIKEGIHPTAVAIGAGAGVPTFAALGEGVNAIWLGRVDAGAADDWGEKSARAERGVADDFGVEAKSALAGEEEIAWIEISEVGAGF